MPLGLLRTKSATKTFAEAQPRPENSQQLTDLAVDEDHLDGVGVDGAPEGDEGGALAERRGELGVTSHRKTKTQINRK